MDQWILLPKIRNEDTHLISNTPSPAALGPVAVYSDSIGYPAGFAKGLDHFAVHSMGETNLGTLSDPDFKRIRCHLVTQTYTTFPAQQKKTSANLETSMPLVDLEHMQIWNLECPW